MPSARAYDGFGQQKIGGSAGRLVEGLGLEDAIPAPPHAGFPGDRQSRAQVQSKGLDWCDR